MKKSKIIVPALAMIAFTTAASISGTVAWFTANRSVSIDAGTYAVVKTNADLQCELKGGVQTTVDPAHPTVVNVATGAKLTDASFDHANGLFTIPDASGKAIAGIVNLNKAGDTDDAARTARLNSDLVQNADAKIYRAFTWRMALSIYFGAAGSDYGLYINTATSKFTVGGGAEAKTAKGFRMAFIPDSVQPTGSSALTRVWADLQTNSLAKYIQSPESGKVFEPTTDDNYIAPQAYVSPVLIDSSTSETLPAETGETAVTKTDAEGRVDCLGTFKFTASSVVKLSYTVVCWFEGTDPEIKNRATEEEYQSVGVTLDLSAIALKAA